MKRLSLLVAATALALSPSLLADIAPGPSDHPRPSPEQRQQRLQQRLERLRDRALALPSGQAVPSASPIPAPSTVAATAGLRAELLKKWAALAATRQERRERHRAALLREVGSHLGDPAVNAELALHATRLADLGRIEFLAQNARAGADREKLLARVAKASARETERHHKRMAQLLAAATPCFGGGVGGLRVADGRAQQRSAALSRHLSPLSAVALASLLLVAVGCSKAQDGGAGASGAPASAKAAVTTAPPRAEPASAATASAPSAGPSPVLTPEDAEDDAAHRITEQNLESELDRLEREIQAE